MAKEKAVQADNVVPIKELPADDAVLALNVAKLLEADIVFDEAKSDHKAVQKHVEAKGVNLKAHAWADKIIRSGETAEAVELFEATLKILKIRGRPVVTSQLDLLTTEDDRTPSVDKAKEAGRYAGIMCFSPSANPYGADSEAGQAWLAAYHGGCAERDLILAMEPKPGSELIKADDDSDRFTSVPSIAAE